MLSRADFVLLGWYQRLVDLLQREPLWLGRQAGILNLLLSCVHSALFSGWGFWPVLGLLLGAFLVWAWTTGGYNPAREAAFRRFTLLFVCVALAFFLLLLAAGGVGARQVLGLLCDLSWLSFIYFCACKPPAPREPRTRLAGAAP